MRKADESIPDIQLLKPAVSVITCHYCAYDPPGSQLPKDGRCPKCYGFSWEKLKIPKSVFAKNLIAPK